MFWHLCWIRELAAGDEEEEDEGIEAEPHLNSHSGDISAATADDSKQQKGEDDDLAEYELDKYDDEEDTGRNYLRIFNLYFFLSSLWLSPICLALPLLVYYLYPFSDS